MSSDPESSSDLEPSNPFKKLSDYPIAHIFSYLPFADLLHLSGMDNNFKRVITKSAETMRKIRLVLDFDDGDLDLDYASKLAQSRRFTGLRLKHVHKLTDANAKVKLLSLLELLSGSVDDLIVNGEKSPVEGNKSLVKGHISRELLSSIIASFLPKLKKCKLDRVLIKADATVAPFIEEISDSVNHPLRFLELKYTRTSEVLHMFAGCLQLKTIILNEEYGEGYNDFEQVNNLLAKQVHLEKLALSGELAWNRLSFFELQELKAECNSDIEEHAAAKFLKKLPKLRQLDIEFYDYPVGSLMKAISEIPKLEKLMMRSWEKDGDDDAHEILVNRTVKILEIQQMGYYDHGTTSKLLKIFLGIESVYLHVEANKLDLSDVPPETIGKIKPSEGCWDFNVKFSPIDVPTNFELFQSAVMIFAESFAEFIIGIKIGHASWRDRREFRVSNSFCQDLVNKLPELCKLKIYNVADLGRFVAFLSENEDRLNLEKVKLLKPFGVDEPEQKKMEIQIK